MKTRLFLPPLGITTIYDWLHDLSRKRQYLLFIQTFDPDHPI
jgi:hypothetical protein